MDFPLVNACLNGASTLLLLAGLGAIKSGARDLHARLMFAAFAVSLVFLGSYPRADGKEPKVPYGGRDSDYQAALDWLRQVSPEIPRLPYDRT